MGEEFSIIEGPNMEALRKDMQAQSEAIRKIKAFINDDDAMVKMIQEDGEIVVKHFQGSPRSFTAYCRKFTPVVLQALVDAGVDPLKLDQGAADATCLGQAIFNPHYGVVAILLEAGCDPYGPHRNDVPAAHSALEGCMIKDFETQFMLVDQMIERDPGVIHNQTFKDTLAKYPKFKALLDQKLLDASTTVARAQPRTLRL